MKSERSSISPSQEFAHADAFVENMVLEDNVNLFTPKDNSECDRLRSLIKIGAPTVEYSACREACFIANAATYIFKGEEKQGSEGEQQRVVGFWTFAATDLLLPQAIELLAQMPGARQFSKSIIESRAAKIDPEVSIA
jgi:hypothetical protein